MSELPGLHRDGPGTETPPTPRPPGTKQPALRRARAAGPTAAEDSWDVSMAARSCSSIFQNRGGFSKIKQNQSRKRLQTKNARLTPAQTASRHSPPRHTAARAPLKDGASAETTSWAATKANDRRGRGTATKGTVLSARSIAKPLHHSMPSRLGKREASPKPRGKEGKLLAQHYPRGRQHHTEAPQPESDFSESTMVRSPGPGPGWV